MRQAELWRLGGRRAALVAVVLAALAALAWGFAARSGGKGAQRTQAGQWIKPQKSTRENRTAFTGALLPARSFDMAPPADGVLRDLPVAWGDRVQKGQLLFTVESPDLDQQWRDAQIARIKGQDDYESHMHPESTPDAQALVRREATAVNAVGKAKARWGETQGLYDKGYVARTELDEAVQQVAQAQQELESVRQELESARRKWSGGARVAATLEQQGREDKLMRVRRLRQGMSARSPIDGVVLYPIASEGPGASGRREFKAGTSVTARDVVMTIGDTSSYLVRGFIAEADTRWVSQGLPVQVRQAGGSGATLPGRVMRVAAQAQPPRGGAPAGTSPPEFEVQVQVPALGVELPRAALADLRIGGAVTVQIAAPGSGSLWELPVAAIQWDAAGQPWVRVRHAAADAAPRAITIARMGTSYALVSDGLEPGDEVWLVGAAPPAGQPPAQGRDSAIGVFIRRLTDED